MFEKYHTFEKPLTMKEIINALSKTLKVSFDESEQNRVKNMYYDLVREKENLRIKTKFLNKFENDDDEHVYHILYGTIWYMPKVDIQTLKWNEMWEDVTDHEMFSSPRFIAFKEKHGRTFISPLKRNNKKKGKKLNTSKKKQSSKKRRKNNLNSDTSKTRSEQGDLGSSSKKKRKAPSRSAANISSNNNNSSGSSSKRTRFAGTNNNGYNEEYIEKEIVFGPNVQRLGFYVDQVRIGNKDMMAVSGINPRGYAAQNTNIKVGDIFVHCRNHRFEANFLDLDDIEEVKKRMATKIRPVSFTIRRKRRRQEQRSRSNNTNSRQTPIKRELTSPSNRNGGSSRSNRNAQALL